MSTKFLIASCLAAGLVWAPARTWTSSDGERTFEGELQAYDATSGEVTVLTNGRQLIFIQDKLSAEDITFLQEWAEKEAEAPASEVNLEEQKVGKELTDRVLSRLDGKRMKRAEMEKKPEYYLLYFSASW
ncbi:hypothetical protein [Roseibacillus ishigakijimensis]|uniref:SLA1 homology domain-containing protein n=1 Tax=Roseibacillus ishigakijimensis TaxID=454146 RepID=A0A934RMV7_9BACT|nr:hypothetical protein [Roseibacillus ishigakijimensis]MBK1833723.1 hypothetical protein [Roseibacillus ishigakijimensis]